MELTKEKIIEEINNIFEKNDILKQEFSLGKTGRESMAPRLRTQFMLLHFMH